MSDSLDETLTRAAKAYADEAYDTAADHYARASELLTEQNGEDSPDNADVLFLYGRALFQIAKRRNEVLGGAVRGGGSGKDVSQLLAAAVPDAGKAPAKDTEENREFTFGGDLEEEEEQPELASDLPVDAEDDFENAWEVLDLARISFQKQLESKDSKYDDKSGVRKRIAESYDLLGEVSLENENFDQAAADLREALQLKLDIYPAEHSEISGGHYMLALALEYSTGDKARSEAARQVELACASFRKRLKQNEMTSRERRDEEEMLKELEVKLKELKEPRQVLDKQQVAELFGLGGASAGNSATQALRNRVADALNTSNDLSGLVRKKEKKRSANELSSTDESEKKPKLT
ncbi:hypothetical protein PYCC9005_005087 [Savitreella phatthalungensis]